jgi:hypothetical protein
MTCAKQTWVGAYVLDALEPDETEAVRRHIAECRHCQDDVVSLAWIPALLRAVPLDEVERLEDADVLNGHVATPVLDRLLVAVRAARRTSRVRRPVVALVAGLAAALTAVLIAVGTGGSAEHALAGPVLVHAVDPRSHVDAAVTLSARTWGTELHLTLSRVPPGEHCSLVVRSRDGERAVAATWTATYRGTAAVPGTTAIPVDSVAELDVIAGDGQRLVRLVVPHGR